MEPWLPALINRMEAQCLICGEEVHFFIVLRDSIMLINIIQPLHASEVTYKTFIHPMTSLQNLKSSRIPSRFIQLIQSNA